MSEHDKPAKAVDLDAIETRAALADVDGALVTSHLVLGSSTLRAVAVRDAALSAADVPALVTEVRRLRGIIDEARTLLRTARSDTAIAGALEALDSAGEGKR